MKRRDFIYFSAFTAAAIRFPLLHSCNQSRENEIAKPVFLSRLFDEKAINDAGKAYIRRTPLENDKNKLIQLLSNDSEMLRSSDQKAIYQYLDQRVKKDFETGNTVLVKGWVLSITEARQCALYSLINN